MGAATDEHTAIKKAKKSKILVPDGLMANETPVKKVKKEKKVSATGEKESKKKKRKADDLVESVTEKKSKKIKQKVEEQELSTAASDSADSEQFVEVAKPAKPADPLALDNFRLSDGVKALLREKGIESLFNIQAQTLNHLLDGFDLVGRAR